MIYIRSSRTWIFMLYIILIICISSMTANELSSFNFLWKYDKAIHFLEYLGVGFLLINMLMIQPPGATGGGRPVTISIRRSRITLYQG